MRKPITVKQLGSYIKNITLTDPFLRNVYVIGEITNLSKRSYIYFSLKEGDETISCILFENEFPFSEGEKVVIEGSINVYLRDGRYQIKVKNISTVGEGEELIKLKKLKDKLQKKGYFDLNNKKQIPSQAYKIGLITGDNSAAYYDFIKILNDNNYNCEIFLYTTLVQGENAPFEISKAIEYLDSINLDLIVLTRGGGSKDDLSIFNNEQIADSIFYSETPIISAVGHEIDFSISDLVSDLRLSTPTKAAEYITYEYKNKIVSLENLNEKIYYSFTNKIINLQNDLGNTNLLIKLNSPLHKLNDLISNTENKKKQIEIKINEILHSNLEAANNIKLNIQKNINNILNSRHVFIKDYENNILELKQLEIKQDYILYNDDISFKIKVEEKINGK